MTIPEYLLKSKEPYSRNNPFAAKLLSCEVLSKKGSSKEVLHVVLDLKDSGFSYESGGSVGLFPKNAPTYVTEILSTLGVDPETIIEDKRTGKSYPLHIFLSEKANLGKITSNHLKAIHSHVPNPVIEALLGDKVKLHTYTESANLYTFLQSFWTTDVPIQALCDAIPPLLPRYYSIASSYKKTPDQLDLMVASFTYLEAGQIKHSVTAEYLRDHCIPEESLIEIFFQKNETFALPEDTTIPIILIGPGTGLAALRAFLQERDITEAEGNNWLFTGDRERAFDFHYQEELEEWVSRGFLRLNTAFSRDGDEKVYVQDRMLENKKDLWDWIHRQNASIYICGDAKHMAKDVQKTLIDIAMSEGHLSEDDAKAYFKEKKKEKKFLLDVY